MIKKLALSTAVAVSALAAVPAAADAQSRYGYYNSGYNNSYRNNSYRGYDRSYRGYDSRYSGYGYGGNAYGYDTSYTRAYRHDDGRAYRSNGYYDYYGR